MKGGMMPEGVKKETTVAKGRQVTLMFQQNRAFELNVAGKVYYFSPMGSMTVDESVVAHLDFKSVAHFFSVTEEAKG